MNRVTSIQSAIMLLNMYSVYYFIIVLVSVRLKFDMLSESCVPSL